MAWHGMMDENRGKRGRQLMWIKTTQENCAMRVKELLKKLKHPEDEECIWFFSGQRNFHQDEKVNRRNGRWLAMSYSMEEEFPSPRLPTRFGSIPIKAPKRQDWISENLHHVTPNLWPPPNSPDLYPLDYNVWGVIGKEVNEHNHNTKFSSLMEAIARAMEDLTILFAQERAASESSDALRGAQTETEKALSKVRSIEVRAAEREADLKDRIRVLEERLVLLTEPDSALFSEHMEQAKLSTSTAIPSDESPEAVATRCVTLLVERLHYILHNKESVKVLFCLNMKSTAFKGESVQRFYPCLFQRKLLETRLVETRKHLEDVKSTWNEKFIAYESQITHLNEKISEDASEFAAERAQWENARQKWENEDLTPRPRCVQGLLTKLGGRSCHLDTHPPLLIAGDD
ncbi:hypothetical protein ACTXT7_012436 [Hymenolepis weldensis]